MLLVGYTHTMAVVIITHYDKTFENIMGVGTNTNYNASNTDTI
jgi:hypothetical protein